MPIIRVCAWFAISKRGRGRAKMRRSRRLVEQREHPAQGVLDQLGAPEHARADLQLGPPLRCSAVTLTVCWST